MRALVALFLIFCLPACSLLGSDDTVPFADVPNVEDLQLGKPGTAVFNEAASWEAFWYDHVNSFDNESTPVPPPKIDFGSKTAVAVFLGGGLSGCSNHVRLVRSISLDGGTAVVDIAPPPYRVGPCDAIINPIHVVEFEKAGAVRFTGNVPG